MLDSDCLDTLKIEVLAFDVTSKLIGDMVMFQLGWSGLCAKFVIDLGSVGMAQMAKCANKNLDYDLVVLSLSLVE